MTNQKEPPLRCKIGPFVWEDRHPILKALVTPPIEDVFHASVKSLSTYEQVDDALRAIDNALQEDRLSAAIVQELQILKWATAWRGCHLANHEINGVLSQDLIPDLLVGLGYIPHRKRQKSHVLAKQRAQQMCDRYFALIQEMEAVRSL